MWIEIERNTPSSVRPDGEGTVHQTTTNQYYIDSVYNAQLRVQNAQFGYRTDIGYCPIVQHPFYIPCPPIYSALALPCIPDHASLDLTTHMSPACMYTSICRPSIRCTRSGPGQASGRVARHPRA